MLGGRAEGSHHAQAGVRGKLTCLCGLAEAASRGMGAGLHCLQAWTVELGCSNAQGRSEPAQTGYLCPRAGGQGIPPWLSVNLNNPALI